MRSNSIKSVIVAGAGSIGIGVARSFSEAGIKTLVLSRNPSRLKTLLPDVELMSKLPSNAPDLVVECLPEIVEIKHSFYSAVETAWHGHPILATNTSSLSFEELAVPLEFKDRFVGMHYMYPAHQHHLFVEVIRTAATSDSVVEDILVLLNHCNKMAIVLNRPVIGGIFNRLQHALLREAYHLIDEGVATPEQIDDMARRFIAPRMCVTGLLKQKDINGLETHTYAQRSLRPALCNETKPSRVLEQHYSLGEFGLKSGKGFYDWSGADPASVRAATEKKVARISALIQEIESDV